MTRQDNGEHAGKKTYIFILSLFLILIAPSISLSDNLESRFENKINTKYFILYFDNSVKNIKALSLLLDGLVEFVDKNLFNVTFKHPVRVTVLKDREHLNAYLRTAYNKINPTNVGAMYSLTTRNVVFSQDAKISYILHETLHSIMMDKNDPRERRNEWYDEGIAMFFDDFFGYVDNEKLHLKFGFHSRDDISAVFTKLKDRNGLKELTLRGILHNEGVATGLQRSPFPMLSMFMWEKGVFKKFLSLVNENKKLGYETTVEAAFGKKLDEIEESWQAYLNKLYTDKELIYSMPDSAIFGNETTFVSFTKKFGAGVDGS